VELGAESAVAAGTTVTDAVPARALAVGRSRQTTVEGWRDRREQAERRDPDAGGAGERAGKSARRNG